MNTIVSPFDQPKTGSPGGSQGRDGWCLAAALFGRTDAASGKSMRGLITQFFVAAESCDELMSILAGGTKDMPGCIGYEGNADFAREDSISVIEAWSNKKSHANVLALSCVQSALARGRPLLNGMGRVLRLELFKLPSFLAER